MLIADHIKALWCVDESVGMCGGVTSIGSHDLLTREGRSRVTCPARQACPYQHTSWVAPAGAVAP